MPLLRRHLSTTPLVLDSSLGRLNDLMAKFRDPASPYHIPAGSAGPRGPDDHASSGLPAGLAWSEPSDLGEAGEAAGAGADGSGGAGAGTVGMGSDGGGALGQVHGNPAFDAARDEARRFFSHEGYDTRALLEWPIAWGECDMFRHVNNVHYARYFESARLHFLSCLSPRLPAGVGADVLLGRGTGIILRDLRVRYRAPVTYPDSLVWGVRVHGVWQARARFGMRAAGWSLKDARCAVEADCTSVMYDYENGRKGEMTDELYAVLAAEAGEAGEEKA
ncbi:hypothetical protein Q5752_005615 [Cryptotrichosporon argae]